MNTPSYTIPGQIAMLKQRGVRIRDEARAGECLQNISYYRLQGYWWDYQIASESQESCLPIYFEDILERYELDGFGRYFLPG
jgi:abortive infection bacteriophage resistance protein